MAPLISRRTLAPKPVARPTLRLARGVNWGKTGTTSRETHNQEHRDVSVGHDTLKTRRQVTAGGKTYDYFSIDAAGEALGIDFSRLPYSLKVLLENLLRFEDGVSVTVDDIK